MRRVRRNKCHYKISKCYTISKINYTISTFSLCSKLTMTLRSTVSRLIHAIVTMIMSLTVTEKCWQSGRFNFRIHYLASKSRTIPWKISEFFGDQKSKSAFSFPAVCLTTARAKLSGKPMLPGSILHSKCPYIMLPKHYTIPHINYIIHSLKPC